MYHQLTRSETLHFPIEGTYVFHMGLTINSGYSPYQPSPVGPYNEDGICSLWGTTRSFVYNLDEDRCKIVCKM